LRLEKSKVLLGTKGKQISNDELFTMRSQSPALRSRLWKLGDLRSFDCQSKINDTSGRKSKEKIDYQPVDLPKSKTLDFKSHLKKFKNEKEPDELKSPSPTKKTKKKKPD